MTNEPPGPPVPAGAGPRALTSRPPKPRRPIPLGSVVLGLLLVAVGVGWLLEATQAVEVPWGAVVPGALIVVGVALLIASRTGQATGGLVAIGVALAVVAALFAWVDVPLGSGVGERQEQPGRIQDLRREYELAAQVDLLDRPADGVAAETAYRDEGYDGADRRLELDLSVGLGRIEVHR